MSSRKNDKERNKRYYLANRERLKKKRAKPIVRRRHHLKKRYGITLDDYDAMFKKQKGLCMLCGKPEKNKRHLHVDHDHVTGKVRGLLCGVCNRALYWLENSEWREKAEQYLKGE
jgi:hypothetical protein